MKACKTKKPLLHIGFQEPVCLGEKDWVWFEVCAPLLTAKAEAGSVRSLVARAWKVLGTEWAPGEH